ncbi:MAG: Ferrichrome-iron receptor [Chitinophagaceae bacterium]|nr:Ferrichrome-iron receptor [Chitinophagaceae bacterium]
MVKSSFLFLLSCVFFAASARSGQPLYTSGLTGKVVDEHHRPVSFLLIELIVNSKKTVNGRNGNFSFGGLLAIQDTLIISGSGIKPFQQIISIGQNEIKDIGEIIIEHDFTQLPGVEITGRISKSYKSDYSYAAAKMQTPLKDIPQAISTITRELINDKMQFRLNEAVTDAAGINLYSGNDEYTIRGFKAENAHLVNGMRTFNSPLVSPMLVNIDRIEIIKGPTSVLYGNADPGGNINLVTKKPLQTKIIEGDIWMGSYNALRAQTDMTGPLTRNKNWLYRFNAGYENTGSFRHGLFNKSFQVAPSFSYIPNNRWQLNTDFCFQQTNTVADRGQPGLLNNNHLDNTPTGLSVVQPGDNLKENDLSAILSFSYKINKHISFNSAAMVYITDQQLTEHGIKGYITPDSVSLYYMHRTVKTATLTLNNYVTFKFNTGKISHQLLTGYDFVSSTVDMNNFNGELPSLYGQGSGIVGTFSLLHPVYAMRPLNTYKQSDSPGFDPAAEEYSTHGIYIQEQAGFGKWQLLLGLRNEYYMGDEEDSASAPPENVLLPRIGLVFKANSRLSFYATYNKGFDPYEAGLTLQVFKEPFKPLYSDLLEAGLKTNLFKNKLAATLAVYRLRVKNIAVSANDPANPDLYAQRGLDQAVGIEGEADGNILPNLSIAVSYAWNVAKIKESSNADEINSIKENAPCFSGSSWLKYTLHKGGLKDLSFFAGHTHQTKTNTLTKGLTLPGFITIQAGLGYSYKRARIALNVNNLFNSTYWVGGYNYAAKWPGSPRSFMINIEYLLR